MLRRRKFGVVLFITVMLTMLVFADPASAASARPERHTTFDREDAFAEFVIYDGGCALARTVVQVGALHTAFRELPAPVQRDVLVGVSISEFDCDGQFVFSAENSVDPGVPFDVLGTLRSASIDLTVEVCQTVPEPGGCFPVAIDLEFTGVGSIDRNRDHDVVNEPNCKINITTFTAVRAADAEGTISFLGRTLSVSSADFTSAGAYLSSEHNETLVVGTGCIEQ